MTTPTVIPCSDSAKLNSPPVDEETIPIEPVVMVTRTGSLPVTSCTLLMNKEEKEDEEREDIEIIKQKRSLSEPNESSSILINTNSEDIIDSAHQTTPTTPPPMAPSIAETTSDLLAKPVAMTMPSSSGSNSSVVNVSRSTPRMVGVVTPTQSVKPYQVRKLIIKILIIINNDDNNYYYCNYDLKFNYLEILLN